MGVGNIVIVVAVKTCLTPNLHLVFAVFLSDIDVSNIHIGIFVHNCLKYNQPTAFFLLFKHADEVHGPIAIEIQVVKKDIGIVQRTLEIL